MIWSGNSSLYQSRGDWLFFWLLRSLAAIGALIILLIGIYLVRESWSSLSQVGLASFFQAESWHPSENLYQMAPMLVASLAVMLGAVLLATPLGILSAVFSQFYIKPYLAAPYRRIMELFAGIPSVVYGFWGLVVLVPWLNNFQPPGASLLAGILIVAIMILPTIALSAEASFARVPKSYQLAAAALGLNRLSSFRLAVWPAARPGVIAGIVLAAGRAIGETMAVIMVCGNIVQLPLSIFDPVRTLSANIALEMAYAMHHHRSALFVSGLVLVLLVLALVFLANLSSRERVDACTNQ